jgi:hypothetical protein
MMKLEEIIQNRRWERHDHPFPYVYAQGVFTDDFYKTLEYETKNILSRGLSETPVRGHFCRNMPGYDAYGTGFNFHETTGNLSVFLTPHWHDVLGNLFGVKGTGYINAGMHHHTINSDHGFIHNDLNPVWFPTDGKGRIRLPDFQRCNYKTGEGSLSPDEKIEVVRGVVMIYYLANDPWFEGDGGETGFYDNPHAKVNKPAAKIPPLNNSLVVYECTPTSWHSFIKNTRTPRTSVIMWIHRRMEDAVENFGEENLERWSICNHPLNPEKSK